MEKLLTEKASLEKKQKLDENDFYEYCYLNNLILDNNKLDWLEDFKRELNESNQ